MNQSMQRWSCALLILFCSSYAAAQTGADLLLKQFPKDQTFEAQADATFLDRGKTDTVDDFRLTQYQSTGRVRVPLDFVIPARAEPRFGYDVKYWDIDSNDNRLPKQLTDTSVAFGLGVLEESGWIGGLSFGVGYAGAGAFDDGNGYYGKADFAIGKTFADESALGFVLDYDGNRTYLPDIPIPGFAYTRRLNEIDKSLLLTLGFPYTSIEWRPRPSILAKLQFDFPDDLTARVEYSPITQFTVFAGYDNYRDAFHDDDLPNSRDRLLFYQRRAEVGTKWNPFPQGSLTAAVGYAFSQEFNFGFDSRDEERVAKVTDEPYFRVGLEIRF